MAKHGNGVSFWPAQREQWATLEIENGDARASPAARSKATPHKARSRRPISRSSGATFSFRIAGGDYERHACLNLLVGGKIVRSATGWNSDRLVAQSWDVRPWAGQPAQLQLVDEASGSWGHINVDQIVQTDRPEQLPVATEPLYQETHRPQFHFTARQWTMDRLHPGMRQEGWLNDLNGLIYYEGEYHLFAQRWNKC